MFVRLKGSAEAAVGSLGRIVSREDARQDDLPDDSDDENAQDEDDQLTAEVWNASFKFSSFPPFPSMPALAFSLSLTACLGARLWSVGNYAQIFEQEGAATVLHPKCIYVRASGTTKRIRQADIKCVAYVCVAEGQGGNGTRFLLNPFPELYPPTHELSYT